MSCKNAMTEKFIAAHPDDGVENILKTMKKAGVESMPVIDSQERLVGIFSLKILMKNLLPVSVEINGIEADVTIAAAPGIAKRLHKIPSLSVNDVMDRKVFAVSPDTAIWEGVNLLMQHDAPLTVVDQGSGKVLGIITYQSALDELNRMRDAN